MPVNSSPRQRESLDYEEPDATDPRLAWGFRSLTLEYPDEYDRHELVADDNDRRSFASSPDPSASRRRRRQRRSDITLDYAVPFEYHTVADGDLFRLCVLLPGAATETVRCELIWESSKKPAREYICLSYCWESDKRNEAILCNGDRFPVTENLLSALQNLRMPTTTTLLWIDQICINQKDYEERGRQVAMMKQIFEQAASVLVWLGDSDDRSERLCEYAKKMRRGEGGAPSSTLNRILGPRQLQDALQRLLQRPWFQRVWVIQEVVLARFVIVRIGKSELSWDNLVRLVRDTPTPQNSDSEKMRFDKQTDLLGNTRQRIAIITQMRASQRRGMWHTDITQLLILAKASKATNVRDMVYAFYGITLLRTFPDYGIKIDTLFADFAHMYVYSLLDDADFAKRHDLSTVQKTQQLMSILYSAGLLHQDRQSLPSWVPDLTCSWRLPPIFVQPISNNVIGETGRNVWTTGVRSEYRAGGDRMETFEVLRRVRGVYHLRLSALFVDAIESVSTSTPSTTAPAGDVESPQSPQDASSGVPPTLCYGRTFFTTKKGFIGVATEGIGAGDSVVILVGGDIPVILRLDTANKQSYRLLCECFIQSDDIMAGHLFSSCWPMAKDIVLI